ncbi:DUF4054 domain-containing protein [Novosphingobium sp. MBES04]|uniref:DUF4054 domain-containing protein n=1 Tax=Novosphingobium sp. MBES04 TaxID=1206458 RepID=UPI00057F0FEA|nr:DUF4054 domain-containing protein [Novosphingobium sp. MBES04]GAM06331.1 hypothetical conserved protein [Novosphingobium sp. MBES04]
MAYVRLTLAAFQAKYPAFTTLTELAYDAWATEAEAEIGSNFGAYQQRATELLTAHYIAVQGIGMGTGAGTLAASGATSFKSGTFSATISDSVASRRAKGDLGSTIWGEQLIALRRRLFGGPLLMGFGARY